MVLAEAQIQKFQRGYGQEWLDLAAQSVAKAQSLNADYRKRLFAQHPSHPAASAGRFTITQSR
jgi:hypothetical protein